MSTSTIIVDSAAVANSSREEEFALSALSAKDRRQGDQMAKDALALYDALQSFRDRAVRELPQWEGHCTELVVRLVLAMPELSASLPSRARSTRFVDIGMRMLAPRELFRAQGFPDRYVIAPIVNGKTLTKTAQIRMCGNSVVPALAEALVRANVRAEGQTELWRGYELAAAGGAS